MKKDSSFKLKSGNDLGRSATKLMKQSPARDIGPSPTEDPLTKNIKDTSELSTKQKLELGKTKLENKVKGFFGNIQKGFKRAKKKRDEATAKRNTQVNRAISKVSDDFSSAKSQIEKGANIVTGKIESDIKDAFKGISIKSGKGGTKGMREKSKKFRFF
tara:strand:+ start:1319 stop:1795 length:477 start_codon:yes stop_codon:yes gene_type:complete